MGRIGLGVSQSGLSREGGLIRGSLKTGTTVVCESGKQWICFQVTGIKPTAWPPSSPGSPGLIYIK